ncbi:MAG: taurine dioxygenase [Rhodospirillaceae bacterium]|nr:taurine dioxygenase [Rhodospirillaceae bacterium]HAA91047.1 TauD/TfdA family dioxygenase [Rhodospirillaceae bacterium]
MAVEFTKLTPNIGIEAHGIDLAEPLGDNVFKSLYDAFATNSVLLIRGQKLTPDQHVAFAKRFGELDRHVLSENLMSDNPEIFVVSNVKEKGEYVGRAKAGWFWHSDFSYQEIPAQASIMHTLECPTAGGDTLFASAGAAFDALSPSMQSFLEGLTAVHDFALGSSIVQNRLNKQQMIKQEHFNERPPVSHPVVRVHPDTGRKTLFVDPGYTDYIEELTREESDNLLDYLGRHATQPQFVYRHHWQPGDILCWDNRGAWHCAIGDYDDDERRMMHRVTVKGTATT